MRPAAGKTAGRLRDPARQKRIRAHREPRRGTILRSAWPSGEPTMSAAILRHLRRRFAVASADAELLDRYLDRRDDDAFRALIERHGPAVLPAVALVALLAS